MIQMRVNALHYLFNDFTINVTFMLLREQNSVLIDRVNKTVVVDNAWQEVDFSAEYKPHTLCIHFANTCGILRENLRQQSNK